MTTDPDPFEQGERAAREKVAGAIKANESEGRQSVVQPIFFKPFLNRGPLRA
jgi:hypothetical protein